MKVTSLCWLLVALPLFTAGCTDEQQPAAAADSPAAKPHMNVLQLMRAFPFPHANVIFDTQGRDPEGPEKSSSMAFSVYRWGDSDVYAGWSAVESSALALAEIAPLLTVPGRLCANGLPAPVDREDWKAAAQGLVAAGEAAYRAAQTKNLDAMLEVSETLTNACAACHNVYRDIDQEGKQRCSVPQ
jgi:hypothetical protein